MSELRDLIGPAFPFDGFDQGVTARAGISNLTGVTVSGKAVNPSIMSEAGDGTVELLVPVLCSCRFQDRQPPMLFHSTT